MSGQNRNIQKPSDSLGDKMRVIKESPKLSEYLNETLKTQDYRKKKKDNKKLSNIETRKIKNNDDKKVRILDKHIFGSMANLIYFFRYIFRHPELIDRFGEDIEELLGLKEESVGEVKFKALGLDSLINLILGIPLASGKGIDIYQYLNDPRFNFKRHLLPILQKTVYSRTTNIMIHRQEDIIFKIMVDNDFQRATTWTEHVDRKPKHAYKPIGRKILLSGN